MEKQCRGKQPGAASSARVLHRSLLWQHGRGMPWHKQGMRRMGLVGRGNSIHLDVRSMQSMCAALVRRAEHCPVSIGFLQTGVRFRRPTHVPGSTTHNFAYKPPPDQKKHSSREKRLCVWQGELPISWWSFYSDDIIHAFMFKYKHIHHIHVAYIWWYAYIYILMYVYVYMMIYIMIQMMIDMMIHVMKYNCESRASHRVLP
jgi:hypothetical protein